MKIEVANSVDDVQRLVLAQCNFIYFNNMILQPNHTWDMLSSRIKEDKALAATLIARHLKHFQSIPTLSQVPDELLDLTEAAD